MIPFIDETTDSTFVMRTNVHHVQMHDLLEQFLIQIRTHDPQARIIAVQLTNGSEREKLVNEMSELSDAYLHQYENYTDNDNGGG